MYISFFSQILPGPQLPFDRRICTIRHEYSRVHDTLAVLPLCWLYCILSYVYYYTMYCSTVLFYTVFFYTYTVILYTLFFYKILLYCILLYCMLLYCIMLFCILLYCILSYVYYYTVYCYTVFFYNVFFYTYSLLYNQCGMDLCVYFFVINNQQMKCILMFNYSGSNNFNLLLFSISA